MMHPVVRWCIENIIKVRNISYNLGMLYESEKKANIFDSKNHYRIKSNNKQWDPEKVVKDQVEKRNSCCCGKIEIFGRMVIYMYGPKQPVLMAQPMKPIVNKLVTEKKKYPCPGVFRNFKN